MDLENIKLEKHLAPEGKLYVHKKKSKGLYGEMVIILPDDLYTIDDFILIDKNELEDYFNKVEESEEA